MTARSAGAIRAADTTCLNSESQSLFVQVSVHGKTFGGKVHSNEGNDTACVEPRWEFATFFDLFNRDGGLQGVLMREEKRCG